jgi:hypothetical protein
MKKILGLMLIGIMVLLVSTPALATADNDNLVVVYDTVYDVPAMDVVTPSADLVSTLDVPLDLGLDVTKLIATTSTSDELLYYDYDVGWNKVNSLYNYSKKLVGTHDDAYADLPMVIPLS